MKSQRVLFLVGLSFIFLFSSLVYADVPQMINYQGKITTPAGALIDTTVEMIFTIYDASTDGGILWADTQSAVVVEKGVFSVLLGSVNPIPYNVFDGTVRYLGVKVGADPEMTPRKSIVSVGYAFKSLEADTANYAKAAPSVPDNDWTFRITDGNDTTLMTGGAWGIARYGNTLYGNADSTHVNLGVASATGTPGQNYKYCTVGGGVGNTASGYAATVGGGQYDTASGNHATVGGGYSNTASGQYATVGGGVGNTASGPRATVGGGDYNTASGPRATVGGGWHNTASGDRSTVGGGSYNTASALYATVGGGYNNTTTDSSTVGGGVSNEASGRVSAVGGGFNNTASGQRSTVGGGGYNTASGEHATVGGGSRNTASGYAATIPGGYQDTVAGDYSFAAGYKVRLTSDADYTFAYGRDFTTSTPNAVIFHNSVTPIKVGIGTTAPDEELHVQGNIKMVDGNQAAGKVLTSDANGVGTWQSAAGGDNDWTFRITDTADTTLMTGGAWGISRYGNTLYGNADSTHVNLGVACTTGISGQDRKYCTAGGGVGNKASGTYSTVGGGMENKVTGNESTVGGGRANTASGLQATVAGGYAGLSSGESSTIGGGWYNTASGIVATVAGGQENTASQTYATVGGGYRNTASFYNATVGGGYSNTASYYSATVGGGSYNTASGDRSTVGGGIYNTASGYAATVGGGYADTAAGDYSFVAGDLVRITSTADYTFAFGRDFTTSTPNAVIFHNSHDPIKVGIGTTAPDEELHVVGNIKMVDGNQAAGKVLTSDANGVGTWQTASGGIDNDWIFRITDTADTTLITGGPWGISRYGNTLYGNADSTHVNLGVACTTGISGQDRKYCTVGGGEHNTASGDRATVGGGESNTANFTYATVAGGFANTASSEAATVAGGRENTASYFGATVGGGRHNTASGYYATVGGGRSNTASNLHATVGGGDYNTASGQYATVGGGWVNTASYYYATVGGGWNNTASGWAATIGGGGNNTASGTRATVAGGRENTASGYAATVGGGYADTAAGDYSFVAGDSVRITSTADYTFAFGRNFTTSTPNAVIFSHPSSATRVGINKTNPAYAIDLPNNANVSGRGRANSWTTYSSIRWKENIKSIENPLDKVLALRGVSFDWKESKKHDIGMIAEEVGEVVPEVVSYEEDGINAQALDYARLTALLVEAIKEQQKRISALEQQIAELKR